MKIAAVDVLKSPYEQPEAFLDWGQDKNIWRRLIH